MAANNAVTPTRKQVSIPPAAYVVAVALAIGVAAVFYLQHEAAKPAPPPAPLTGAAKDYVKFLRFVSADGQQLENPTMTAHESYVKQSVVEVRGNLMNGGDRVIQVVEIVCIFYDPYGHELMRERVPIVSQKMGKLAPGEFKPFRLAFDSVPEEWNQAMPQMVIARIEFT